MSEQRSGCSWVLIIACGIIAACILVPILTVGGCAAIGIGGAVALSKLPPVPGAEPSPSPVTIRREPSVPTERPAPITSARSKPRPVPNDPESQKRALDAFPELAVTGSATNRIFLVLVKRAQTEDPEIFDDPDWPLRLAKQADRAAKETP